LSNIQIDVESFTNNKNCFHTEPVPSFNKAGIAGKGKNIITKHDSHISGRRNANKMEQVRTE
jgi:hypothetical protein